MIHTDPVDLMNQLLETLLVGNELFFLLLLIGRWASHGVKVVTNRNATRGNRTACNHTR